jgi:hypothetical protein
MNTRATSLGKVVGFSAVLSLGLSLFWLHFATATQWRKIRVQNNLSIAITISVDGVHQSQAIPPGEQVTLARKFIRGGAIGIEAKDLQGKSVSKADYIGSRLDEVDDGTTLSVTVPQ